MDAKRDIFEFLSARDFLKALYIYKKKQKKKYSHPVFSKELGLSASTHIYQFLKGNRDLSEEAVLKIGKALKLPKKSLKYLQIITKLDQTKDQLESSAILGEALALRKDKVDTDLSPVTQDYLRQWYFPLIRELVDLPDFQPQPEWIVSKIGPSLTLKQAKEAFQVLQKHGFIEFSIEDQKWVQKEVQIHIPDGTKSSILSRIQSEYLELAKASIWNDEPEERDIACMMLGVEEAMISEFKADLEKFRQEISKKYATENPERIVMYASQLFNLSKSSK